MNSEVLTPRSGKPDHKALAPAQTPYGQVISAGVTQDRVRVDSARLFSPMLEQSPDKFINKFSRILKYIVETYPTCSENQLGNIIPEDEGKISLDWFLISKNPNITWDFIKNNPKLPWDRVGISMNQNITWDIYFDNKDFDWDFESLASNPNMSEDIIKKFFEGIVTYDSIVYNPNILSNQKLLEEITEHIERKETFEQISMIGNLTSEFIEKHKNDLDWILLSGNEFISVDQKEWSTGSNSFYYGPKNLE